MKRKKETPLKCDKCGKPIVSKPDELDHNRIAAIFGKVGKVTSYHAECAPRQVPRRFGIM